MVKPVIEREGALGSRCGVERSLSSTATNRATPGQAEVLNQYGCESNSKPAQNWRILPSTRRCAHARQCAEKRRRVVKPKRRASRLAHQLRELLIALAAQDCRNTARAHQAGRFTRAERMRPSTSIASLSYQPSGPRKLECASVGSD